MEVKKEVVQRKNSQGWKRIENSLKQAEDCMNLISVFFILFLMFFSVAEVSGRYFFNSPIPGYIEIVEQCMAGVVFLGIAYTERVGAQIRTDFFIKRFFTGRTYHICEAISTVIALFVFVFITFYTFQHALYSGAAGECTSRLSLPTWPSKLIIPVGSFFLCIRLTLEVFQDLFKVMTDIQKNSE